MKILPFILSFLLFQNANGQTRQPYVWKHTMTYRAIYLNSKNDTLSNELIVQSYEGKMWQLDKNQFSLKRKYDFSKTDTTKFTAISGRHIKWDSIDITGAGEDNNSVWFHPFRDNQYELTEIAPFPSVDKPKFVGKTWDSNKIIGSGWGAFEGNTKAIYRIVEHKKIVFATKKDLCWFIESEEKHPKLGINKHYFIFNDDYGFIEMKYLFFNGDKMHFKVVTIN